MKNIGLGVLIAFIGWGFFNSDKIDAWVARNLGGLFRPSVNITVPEVEKPAAKFPVQDVVDAYAEDPNVARAFTGYWYATADEIERNKKIKQALQVTRFNEWSADSFIAFLRDNLEEANVDGGDIRDAQFEVLDVVLKGVKPSQSLDSDDLREDLVEAYLALEWAVQEAAK